MWSRENQVVYGNEKTGCCVPRVENKQRTGGWKYDIELNQNHPRVCKQHNKLVCFSLAFHFEWGMKKFSCLKVDLWKQALRWRPICMSFIRERVTNITREEVREVGLSRGRSWTLLPLSANSKGRGPAQLISQLAYLFLWGIFPSRNRVSGAQHWCRLLAVWKFRVAETDQPYVWELMLSEPYGASFSDVAVLCQNSDGCRQRLADTTIVYVVV